jgi:hypothetical protein
MGASRCLELRARVRSSRDSARRSAHYDFQRPSIADPSACPRSAPEAADDLLKSRLVLFARDLSAHRERTYRLRNIAHANVDDQAICETSL